MPVLDWTRTDLTRRWPDGSEALAYDADDLAAFDLFILKREGGEKEYEPAAFSRAKAIFDKMSDKDKETLQQNIIAGLPGRMVEAYTVEEFRQAVAQYKNVSPSQIRENLAYFLKNIIPTCEEAGVYMAIHPDDPPRPILGLPPACSTRDDVAALLKAVDSKHNGITLCVGTYASSPQNKAGPNCFKNLYLLGLGLQRHLSLSLPGMIDKGKIVCQIFWSSRCLLDLAGFPLISICVLDASFCKKPFGKNIFRISWLASYLWNFASVKWKPHQGKRRT